MNPRRRKLLITATFIVVGVTAATLLGLKAFKENLLYFYSHYPSHFFFDNFCISTAQVR